MNTDMKLQKVPVEKLKPAKYNPRKDLNRAIRPTRRSSAA